MPPAMIGGMARTLVVLALSMVAAVAADGSRGGSRWRGEAWSWRGDGWHGDRAPGWSVRRARAWDGRWARARGCDDGWDGCDDVAVPLDPPTRTVREPGHWETTADGQRVWVPDAFTTEPEDVVTRGAGSRDADAPSREAPTQADIDDAVEARERDAALRRFLHRAQRELPAEPAAGGSSAGAEADRR